MVAPRADHPLLDTVEYAAPSVRASATPLRCATPARLGELLVIKEGDAWALAVVRRMQRRQIDDVVAEVGGLLRPGALLTEEQVHGPALVVRTLEDAVHAELGGAMDGHALGESHLLVVNLHR